jgi:hypothetical protein
MCYYTSRFPPMKTRRSIIGLRAGGERGLWNRW